mgnify:CR=1 FL=1
MTIQCTEAQAYIAERSLMGTFEGYRCMKEWVVITGTEAKFYQALKPATRYAEKTGGFPINSEEAKQEGLIEIS